jgi:hypothetical protein
MKDHHLLIGSLATMGLILVILVVVALVSGGR